MYSIYRLTLSMPDKPDCHYVGCTSDDVRRKAEHLYKLRKGIHPNKALLSLFQSGAAVSFVVIETAKTLKSGEKLETSWTELLRSKGDVVFNRRHDAGSNRGFTHTEETKARISASLAGRNTRSKSAIKRASEKLRGRVKPDHVIAASQEGLKRWRANRDNIAAAVRKNAPLTDDQIVAIRASTQTYSDIAKEFSTFPSTVCKIKHRKSYWWVP